MMSTAKKKYMFSIFGLFAVVVLSKLKRVNILHSFSSFFLYTEPIL